LRSCCLADRPAQTRTVKLAVFGIPQIAGVPYHDRGDAAQPCDDLFRVIKPTYMRVTGDIVVVKAPATKEPV